MRPLLEARMRSEARESRMKADAVRGPSRDGWTEGEGNGAWFSHEDWTHGAGAWPDQPLEHVAAGAFEATLSGEITGANSALAELLGFASRQDLVGSSLAELLVDPATLERVLDHVREGQHLRGVEVPLRTKRGDEVVVLLCTKLMGSVRGPGRRVMGILIDITERKRRASNLARPTSGDPSTGVTNRRDLDEHAARHLALTVRRGTLLWD